MEISFLGIITTYIAYMQWLTAERVRRQFLFDKRYNFYEKLKGRYFSLDNKEEAGYSDCLDAEDLNELEYQAKWLFGDDMLEAIKSMYGKKLNVCNRVANTLPDDIENIFCKYLKIEKENKLWHFLTKTNKLKNLIIFILSLCIVSNCYAATQKTKVEKLNYDLDLCKSFLNDSNTIIYDKKSIKILYDAFKTLDKYWYKGEFETTAEFEKRKKEEKETLYKKIEKQLGSEFIVYRYKLGWRGKYDADTKIFKIRNFSSIWSDYGEELDGTILNSGYKEYIEKQNAFGAKILVENSKDKKFVYASILPDKITKKNNYWPREEKKIKLDIEKAKNLKENLNLLIIARTSDILFKSKYYSRKATFNNPREYSSSTDYIILNPVTACYYNADTKEVYSLDNE